MNLLEIMRAQRKSGKPPTLKIRRWNAEQRQRLSEGLCVTCGKRPAQVSSYLCAACEGQTSPDDIRSEIERIRARILGK